MPAPNYSDVIEKNMLGHIKYRDAIRTGEIITDNGDGTYDVKIALSDKIYPSVETLTYEMKFAVGEIAVLSFEYGNKESPKIMGHGKKIAQDPVEVEVGYSGTARVNTLDAYSLTSTTAYLEGRIILGGAGNCTTRGFQYGTTTAYGSDTHTNGSYGDGSYAILENELAEDTTYHFRAYIIDENGDTRYGADKTFVTLEAEVILGDIYICYWTGSAGNEVGYIKSFTSDGVAGISWTAEDYQLLYNGACVDNADNIYYIANTQPNHTLVKYNKSGGEIVKLVVSYQAMAIAIANDGYIYTKENTQTDNNMMTKRNPTTLAEISSFQMDPYSYYGMAFYDDDRFYVVNSSDDVIEMWRVETGGEIGEVAVTSTKTSLASLAKTGATVLGTDFAKQPWYVPTNLSAGETDWSTEITRCFSVTSKDGYFYVFGNKVNGEELYLGKYSENGTKQWLVEAVPTGYYPSTVAAYPF